MAGIVSAPATAPRAGGSRLGLHCLWQRCSAGLGEGAPDPPQPRRARRPRLLPDPRPPRHRPCRARAGGRHALDDRGLLRGGQGRGRPDQYEVRSLDRLAPSCHARHAGPRLSVATRNDARPDARFRAVSGARWVRLERAADANSVRPSAWLVRRTRDRGGRARTWRNRSDRQACSAHLVGELLVRAGSRSPRSNCRISVGRASNCSQSERRS